MSLIICGTHIWSSFKLATLKYISEVTPYVGVLCKVKHINTGNRGRPTWKSALNTICKSWWSHVTLLLCYLSLQALPRQQLQVWNVLASCPSWALMGVTVHAVSLVVVALTLQYAVMVHDYYLNSIFVWTDVALTDGTKTTGCCELMNKWPNMWTGYQCWFDCLVYTAALLMANHIAAEAKGVSTNLWHHVGGQLEALKKCLTSSRNTTFSN